MESRQKLTLPADRYPLKITSLRVTAGSEVRRDDVLGIYEYDNNNPQEAGNATATTSRKRTVREEWRSPYSGRVDEVCVKEGEVVVGVRKTLAVIIEPCGHAIQVHGICATCGKDVSIGTYMGNDLGRATINMAHDNRGVTISRDVAVKLDNERSERLLVSKKLTLILDLDQTLVHATVDPTVAQWMDDPSNPNQQFLKDVHKFEIPSYHTHFVKLRPGTREFLLEMNEIYELHIYTMGSRQYADQIANILDQDRALFKDRIISRDENRSNFKSIQRLFPSDQSMVVIVDDRSDIWHWSPNLYKILPFNFFVGTGDINAPRLPPSGPPQTPQAASKPAIPDKDHDTVTSLEKELSDEDVQHQFLEDLEKTRPLERLSEELDAEGETQGITGVDADAMDVVSAKEEKENAVSDTPPTPKPASPPPTSSSSSSSTPPAPPTAPPKRRPSLRTKPILTDSDRELDRVCKVLKDVHRAFYSGAVEESRRLGVGGIMARQKKAVLAGVRIVFSGVISTDVDGRTTDIWVGAEQFGAKCVFDLSDDVTHLVTVKQQGLNKTNKVRRARKMPGVFIVSLDWLYDSICRWDRQDETRYLLEPVFRPTALPIDTHASPKRRAKRTAKADHESGSDSSPDVSDDNDDDDDEKILSGTWEHENDIFIRIGEDDILAMDREIEEALAEESGSDVDVGGGDKGGGEGEGHGEGSNGAGDSQSSGLDFDALFDEEFAVYEERRGSVGVDVDVGGSGSVGMDVDVEAGAGGGDGEKRKLGEGERGLRDSPQAQPPRKKPKTDAKPPSSPSPRPPNPSS